jgi:hypothetical protein
MSEQYIGDGGGPTTFGDFQSLGYLDRIYPSVEKANWQSVENGLRSVNTESYIKEEGTWTEDLNADVLTLRLEPINTSPSFEGVINGEYFRVTKDVNPDTGVITYIQWDVDVSTATTWYLYLRPYTGGTHSDHSKVSSIEAYISSVPPNADGSDNQTALIAGVVVVTAPSVYTVATTHLQKMTSGALMKHICKSSDPHGETQSQTNLTTSGNMTSNGSLFYKEAYQYGTIVRHEHIKKIDGIIPYVNPGDETVINLNTLLSPTELGGKTAIIDVAILTGSEGVVWVFYPFDADSGKSSSTISIINESGIVIDGVVGLFKYRLI